MGGILGVNDKQGEQLGCIGDLISVGYEYIDAWVGASTTQQRWIGRGLLSLV